MKSKRGGVIVGEVGDSVEVMIASLTLYDLPKMSAEGRFHLAEWLRDKADALEKMDPSEYAGRFRQSYRVFRKKAAAE